jgi:hypothetical protein
MAKNDISIFSNPGAVTARTGKKPLTALGEALVSENTNQMRRLQPTLNGTFRRLVGGEQIGKSIDGSINVIVINALPSVSRTFYAKAYDKDAEPTLPNCWSNLGDKPDPGASDPQSPTCAGCSQNVKGSGQGESRACRFNRRLAIVAEGDTTGEIYQLNVAATSLFGKGLGNVHPFESYVRFLAANGESPDTVVTNVAFNKEADFMQLEFTPVRNLNDAELKMVQETQADPEATTYTQLTVAAADGVSKKPEAEDKETEPTKRAKRTKAAPPSSKKISEIASAWGDDEDSAE